MQRKDIFFVLMMILVTLFLTSCGASSADSAGKAVESYLNALVKQDAAGLSTLSCAEWENQAIMEMDSFQAVSATLEGMMCQTKGVEGEFTLVTCQGKIVATYNNEKQELDLSLRTYQVAQKSGEWLVCGYQ